MNTPNLSTCGNEITRRASNVVVPNTASARTLVTVLEQVRSSYLDRDPGDQTYIKSKFCFSRKARSSGATE